MAYFDVPDDLLVEPEPELEPEPAPEPEPPTLWQRLRGQKPVVPAAPRKPMRRQRVPLDWTVVASPGGDGVDDFVCVQNPARVFPIVRHFGGPTWYRFCLARHEFVEHGETKLR